MLTFRSQRTIAHFETNMSDHWTAGRPWTAELFTSEITHVRQLLTGVLLGKWGGHGQQNPGVVHKKDAISRDSFGVAKNLDWQTSGFFCWKINEFGFHWVSQSARENTTPSACSHLMPFSLHSQLRRWGFLPQIPPLWYERFFGGFQIVLAITVRLTKISKYQARTLLTLLKVGICCFKNSVALRQRTV